MRGRYLVDTDRWDDESAGWKVDMSGALAPEFNALFGTGFAAAEAGNPPLATQALAGMKTLLPQLAALFNRVGVPAHDPARQVPEMQKLEVRAALFAAGGQLDQAVATTRQAVAIGGELPYGFGPPSPQKPANELLGELLLKEHQPAQARAAFEFSLKLAPRRTSFFLGLARAETAMGDPSAAANTYGELRRIWKKAEPGYAPRAEAQRAVTSAPGSNRHAKNENWGWN